jgi:hypothetical protein
MRIRNDFFCIRIHIQILFKVLDPTRPDPQYCMKECHVNAHIAHICTVIRMFYLRFLVRENEEEKRERNDVSLRSSNVRKEQTQKKGAEIRKEKMWIGRLYPIIYINKSATII